MSVQRKSPGRGRSSRALVLACACAVIAAVGLAPAGADAASPFRGDAMWVWYVSASGGSAEKLARKADRRGLDAIYVKSGDGGDYWSQFDRHLVRAAHARGLRVCGWQFVYGRDPGREAKVGAGAAADGADCLIIDAESDYEGRYAAADAYVRSLRRRVGDDYPLGLSSFPYVDYHPAFPYSVFLGPGGAQANLPQLYWYAIGDPVAAAFRHTYAFNRPYDRRLFPVGQTWMDPPKGQVLDFRRLAAAYGSSGVSWWSWQETGRKMWPRLSGRLRGGVPGPRPRREYAALARGARGDRVLWAQEHLRGAGLDAPVNGRFNRRTQRAVKALQRRAGVEASGDIDGGTWTLLLAAEPERIAWSRRGDPRALRRHRTPASARLAPLADEIPPPRRRLG
ncbi:MAG: peptidoglycan-binding protein [Solirubrobacterales bacterium]|nr:peptidoglycan-binding protein [Solirubrobacterales bacterium]